jgi:hypothetical protein
MNKERIARKALREILALIKEYDDFFPKKMPANNFDTGNVLTPREFIDDLKNIIDSRVENISRFVAINNYLQVSKNAIDSMAEKHPKCRPFVSALRQIAHFFRALFTREPFKVSLGKSEVAIFANRLKRAAYVKDAPTIAAPSIN